MTAGSTWCSSGAVCASLHSQFCSCHSNTIVIRNGGVKQQTELQPTSPPPTPGRPPLHAVSRPMGWQRRAGAESEQTCMAPVATTPSKGSSCGPCIEGAGDTPRSTHASRHDPMAAGCKMMVALSRRCSCIFAYMELTTVEKASKRLENPPTFWLPCYPVPRY